MIVKSKIRHRHCCSGSTWDHLMWHHVALVIHCLWACHCSSISAKIIVIHWYVSECSDQQLLSSEDWNMAFVESLSAYLQLWATYWTVILCMFTIEKAIGTPVSYWVSRWLVSFCAHSLESVKRLLPIVIFHYTIIKADELRHWLIVLLF